MRFAARPGRSSFSGRHGARCAGARQDAGERIGVARLNPGLRDAFELVQALARNLDVNEVQRRLEWQRGPDRCAIIAAADALARSVTWTVKSALAKQMMYGRR